MIPIMLYVKMRLHVEEVIHEVRCQVDEEKANSEDPFNLQEMRKQNKKSLLRFQQQREGEGRTSSSS